MSAPHSSETLKALMITDPNGGVVWDCQYKSPADLRCAEEKFNRLRTQGERVASLNEITLKIAAAKQLKVKRERISVPRAALKRRPISSLQFYILSRKIADGYRDESFDDSAELTIEQEVVADEISELLPDECHIDAPDGREIWMNGMILARTKRTAHLGVLQLF